MGDLETLRERRDAWAAVGPAERVALLEETRAATYARAAEWVALSARAKGLAPGSHLEGEEWISGPWAVLYAINRYIRTLKRLARGLPPVERLRVFPYDLYDRILLTGVSADVRLKGHRIAFLDWQQAPRVALVLGAGNISSIAPLDVLYKLLAENAVCLVKPSPVNDYLTPVFERAFAPLVSAGFVRFVRGDAEKGAELCADPLVDEIHVTGSVDTYAAIKSLAGAKRVTGELGSVTPTIVVPGNWSERDLRFQAENVATQKAHNAGFNCIAAQVLIVSETWKLKTRFLAAIETVFESTEARPEYYPGASGRRRALGGAGATPSLVRLDPQAGAQAFSSEAFCNVLFCVELPGDSQNFLATAVRFANERLYGSLGANLIVDPVSERTLRAELDEAISELRYGCVAVNAWAGVGYFLAETPWGAYGGETGFVHNSYLLDDVEKSRVRAPFRPLTKPPWFVTNEKQAELGRLLCDFEAGRSPVKALRIIRAAL